MFTNLELAIISGIGLLVVLFLLTGNQKKMNKKHDELMKEEKQLLEEIEKKYTEYQILKQQISQNQINSTVNLPEIVNEVLDIYDQSGIRIQADILEELSIQTFYDHKEVFDFIENHRKQWKIENTKKPFKKV